MSAMTLARRRQRIVERIAAGRMDIIDDIDTVIEPLRKIDRLRASFGRLWGQSREAAPMLYPLAPVAALVVVRGRRHVGRGAVGVLKAMLKVAALTRTVRQLAPFVGAISRGARRHVNHDS